VEGLENRFERLNKVVADARYDLACLRASDIRPDCLNVIKSNTGRHRPRCLFGCQKRRLSQRLLTEIEGRLARAQKWRDIRIASGENKADVVKSVGEQAVMDCWEMILLEPFDFDLMDYCYTHKKECPVYAGYGSKGTKAGHAASKKEEKAEKKAAKKWKRRLRANISGTECTAWSGMGQQMGWTHESMITYLIWMRDRWFLEEDFFIHECTSRFGSLLMARLLRPKFEVETEQLEPYDFGVPEKRPRKISLGRNLKTVIKLQQFHSFLFGSIFFKTVSCDCSVFAVATTEEQEEKAEYLALKRNFPARDPRGKAWSIRSVMQTPKRERVREYEYILAKKGYDASHPESAEIAVNVTQNPHVMHSLGLVLPSICQGSEFFMIKRQRVYLGTEMLLAMGMPIRNYLHKEFIHKGFVDFHQLLKDGLLSDKNCRSMAGNGMHVRVLGAALEWALATTSPAEGDDEG